MEYVTPWLGVILFFVVLYFGVKWFRKPTSTEGNPAVPDGSTEGAEEGGRVYPQDGGPAAPKPPP